MKSLAAAALAAFAVSAEANPNVSVEAWLEANHTCETGENHDGEKVSEFDMKAACVTLGVLTVRLTDMGLCMAPDGFDWKPCE